MKLNLNPSEVRLILEMLKDVDIDDRYYSNLVSIIASKINSKTFGKFEEVEEEAIGLLGTKEKHSLKNVLYSFHDVYGDIANINPEKEAELDKDTDDIAEDPDYDNVIDVTHTYLENNPYYETKFKTEKEAEEWHNKFNEFIKERDLNGFIDFLTEQLLELGQNESQEWKDAVKKEFAVDKINIKKGKGWFGETERHSKAKLTGKADLIEDSEGKWITIKGRHVLVPTGHTVHFNKDGSYETISSKQKEEKHKGKVEKTGKERSRVESEYEEKQTSRKKEAEYKEEPSKQTKNKIKSKHKQLQSHIDKFNSLNQKAKSSALSEFVKLATELMTEAMKKKSDLRSPLRNALTRLRKRIKTEKLSNQQKTAILHQIEKLSKEIKELSGDFLVEDSMDSLVQWVIAKKLTTDPKEAEEIAFAISNSNKSKKQKVQSQKSTIQEVGESYSKSQEQEWESTWSEIGEAFTKQRLARKKTKDFELEYVGTVNDTTIKTHETENYIRKRQFDPKECEEGTYRTFNIGKGKKAVGCKVKGKFKAQSILEPKKSDYIDLIPLSSFKQVKHDFQEDFTMLHGTLARDGAYDYYDSKGNKMTLYKKWDNLKEYYTKYDYLPIRGTKEKGAHIAEEIGFGYNFYPNESNHTIEFDGIFVNDLPILTDLLNPKEGYHVSPGYEDKIIDGNIQLITKLDHIAVSLGNKDTARACTGTNDYGFSCTTVFPIHDQNLKNEVVN